MQKIIDEFKSMNLKETSKRNTSDYVYRIDIYYKDDGFDCIEIRESDVEILGIYYKTDMDYCSKWKESFE